MLVTNGGKQAVYQACATLLDPGDEVLLPAPYWTTYPEAIALAGGVTVQVDTDESSGFLASVAQLEAARTPRTKALLFCSPSNPTGAVYSPDQVAEIGRWAVEHGIWVLTDEIYEHLVYGDATFSSMPVVVPELRRHVRGAERCREDLRDDRLAGGLDDRSARRHQGRDQPPVAPDLQRRQRLAAGGARGGLGRPVRGRDDARSVRPPAPDDGDDAERHSRASCVSSRRARSTPTRRCKAILGLELRGRRPATSAELAELVLEEAEVAVVPGEAFGTPGYFRLSYALGDDDLVEGVNRLGKLLSEAR